MENSYMVFVESLRRLLIEETGFGEERIYFKAKETYPQTAGDRLFLVSGDYEGGREVCALYVWALYERYMRGCSLEEICDDVLYEVHRIINAGFREQIKHLRDYETVRNHLFVRLLNVERNKCDLKNAVYYVLGDVALVLYMKIGEQDEYVTSMKIRTDMMDAWGVEKKRVFETALKNTYVSSPPRIYDCGKMMLNPDYDGDDFMDVMSECEMHGDFAGNCLSTTNRTNGAVAIFLPGVAKRLADLIGESFYIVFTSVHEAMIHNERYVELDMLYSVLKDTVREMTPDEDVLTLKIYRYDKELGIFSLA